LSGCYFQCYSLAHQLACKYTRGLHSVKNTTSVFSRCAVGMGIPMRIPHGYGYGGSKFRPHGSPGVQLPTSADNVTLLAVVRQWIDIICPPDGPTAANRRPNDGTDRQTDRRTLASFVDPAAHSCIRAVSEITKQHNYVGRCAVVIATAHIFLISLLPTTLVVRVEQSGCCSYGYS